MAAVGADPGCTEGHAALGTLFKACGLPQEAAACLETALAQSPENAELQGALAAALTDLGALHHPFAQVLGPALMLRCGLMPACVSLQFLFGNTAQAHPYFVLLHP